MKLVSLILGLALSLPTAAFAVCDTDKIKKNVEEYSYKINNGYGTRFESAKIEGTLQPGEKMNIFIAVDDFDIANRNDVAVLVASLFGRNLVGDSFWIAELNPGTCAVVSAFQILGTGDGL